MQQHTLAPLLHRSTGAVRRFLRDERGATAVEYALLASLIGVAIIGATTTLGGKINQVFQLITQKLNLAT